LLFSGEPVTTGSMKNGEHDLAALMAELQWQRAALQVLLRHVAHVEAIVEVLTVKSLNHETLVAAKGLKDDMQPKIVAQMNAEIAAQ
jgi:hypothetical protein